MVFHHLSLASHRWAHKGSRDIGLLPYTLQVSGILMTSSHHARHHVTFDTNFCFLGGWSDALINAVFFVIPQKSVILWSIIWMLYLAGPHYFALYLLKRRDRLAWRSVIRKINRKHIYAAFGLTVLVSFGSLTLPRFDDASLSFPAKEVQSKFEIESETTISHISNVNATFTAEQVARRDAERCMDCHRQKRLMLAGGSTNILEGLKSSWKTLATMQRKTLGPSSTAPVQRHS